MNIFNSIFELNFYLLIVLGIIYILRMVISIIGISYAMTIMDTPNSEKLRGRKIREFLVIIISILWIFIKVFIFKLFISFFIIIPLISYLLINKTKRKAKGIAFLILSLSLMIL